MDARTLDDCGCCGSRAEPDVRTNPPGLAALPFRSGTQATVLRRMLTALADGFPELTARTSDDPAVALLDAWATVADVVTFYQERILNEGFLRTATERRSVLELARAIGYELHPGVAASTDLSFSVESVPGAPRSAVVPERTKVLSIPGQGERSQTFETDAALAAVVELNEVRLRLRKPQVIGQDRTGVYLAGVTTGLQPGDAVLIVRRRPTPDVQPPPALDKGQRDFRILRSVEPRPAAGPVDSSATLVRWDGPLGKADTDQDIVEVYAFRQRASIFGQNAPDFRTMPEEIRARYTAAHPAPPAPAVPPPAAPVKDEWPGFDLPGDGDDVVIDLDAAYPALLPGSFFVFRQAGKVPVVCTVKEAQLAAGADFGITARTTRVTLDRVDGLTGFNRREAVVHTQTELLPLADEPIGDPAEGKNLTLAHPVPLVEKATVLVSGETPTGALVVQKETVGPVTGATVEVAPPLPQLRRDSVRVLGNVVPATHGETVDDEVLGSGNGTATHQRFTLRKPDLTHVSAATTRGVVSTLEVRVDGVLWTEVPSLFLAGPQDRVYVVRIDDDARATVIFGDGERGSRLPTGQENVRARYRSGIGPEGDVPADALSLLPQRPLGIAAVTNPLPARGGVGPERLDDARVNAPLTVLTLDRVVSVRDHEDFARAFAGIAKARAVALRVRSSLLVHLTVAAAAGADVDPKTVATLGKAIAAYSDGVSRLRVASFQPRPFVVGLALLTDPARVRSDVEAAVGNTLLTTFAADRRSFGQPVTAAEVLAAVQPVPGVVAAVLTALHREKETGVQEVLVARDARFAPTDTDPDRILPAELLLLHATDISFTEMAP